MDRQLKNLWQSTARESFSALSLDSDISTDLVIIGGGFTGCSAALEAATNGMRVCLIEAETIGYGGSGRNVGFANAGLWLPPEAIKMQLGEKAGSKLNNALGSAPDLVFSFIEEHDIACDTVRNGTLHCAHSKSGLKDLQDRHRQLKVLGAPVTLLDKQETKERTGTDKFHGSLYDARAGTIQPLAYCRGLARAAKQSGVDIYENTPALSIEQDGMDWCVKTPSGKIKAQMLLLATNAYHQDIPSLPAPSYVPMHYFQIATMPLTSDMRDTIMPGGEGCWDTATVMTSFRLDATGRLIIGAIGGLDHGAQKIHRNWAKRKITSLYPHLGKVELDHAWCGTIAMTSDHIPKIVKLEQNGYTVFGYSGRGIGPGTAFGKTIAQALFSQDESRLILDPVDHYSESLTAVKGAFYETGAVLTHLVN